MACALFRAFRDRWLVKCKFIGKDFVRVFTRYDRFACNYLSAIILATAVAFWL